MSIAEQFTYNDDEYGLYMTDVSFDNFAVDEHGKVFVVDAENIIVVDRKQIKEGREQSGTLTEPVPYLSLIQGDSKRT